MGEWRRGHEFCCLEWDKFKVVMLKVGKNYVRAPLPRKDIVLAVLVSFHISLPFMETRLVGGLWLDTCSVLELRTLCLRCWVICPGSPCLEGAGLAFPPGLLDPEALGADLTSGPCEWLQGVGVGRRE